MNMTDYRASLYHRVLRWREEHISEKRFILILSFLVGIFTALAAWGAEMDYPPHRDFPDGEF